MAHNLEAEQSDYEKFRGKCLELSTALVATDPSLRLVRGFYFCPIWNVEEPHWWCEREDGTVVDPSARQYPSKGLGLYREFDGMIACEECGTEVPEADAYAGSAGRGVCSARCYGRLVGIYC